MRYFSGSGSSLGTVSALPQRNFAALCSEVIEHPVTLTLTREAFWSLTPKERNGAKRVDYITPAAFDTSPSQRTSDRATRCNLLCLDVDSADDARRLLALDWSAQPLGDLAFVLWHTASSTPEAPRLRVLVSAEGIPPARYAAAVRTLADRLGLVTVTHESCVPVQPMYRPIVFADGGEPIVAINRDGEPFMAFDILGDEDAAVDAAPPTGAEDVANLEFLRTPLDDVTLDDAESALQHMDPDCSMQQWIEVAAALKHQFDNDDAYALWDAWSARGKKYVDGDETRYRWKTLKAQPKDRAPVTIRSLFRSAQARGWTNPALGARQQAQTMAWLKDGTRSTEQLLDEGVKRLAKVAPVVGALERKALLVTLHDRLKERDMPVPLNDLKKAVRQLELDAARTTGLPAWCKGLCFITANNTFYRPGVDRKFAPEVLDLIYSTPQIGDDKPMRPRDYAIQIAGIPQVENARYDPTRGEKRFFTEDNIPYVNTYRPCYAPPEPDRADEAGAVMTEHVANLVKEEKYQTLLLDFLTYMVQFPGRKIRWAPLIQSGEGAGKTFLHACMHVCLGGRNVFKLSGPDLMQANFNDWAAGRQLVTIEEIRVIGANRHAVMDRLKTPITDDWIPFHEKHEARRTVPNVTNYLMFTNFMDALAVTDEGRRYFVLSSPLQNADDVRALGPDYFARIYGMVRDNPGGLRAWFQGRAISSAFDPEGRAPKTPYLSELADNAASPLSAAVRETLSDSEHPLIRRDLVSGLVLRSLLEHRRLPDFSDQGLAAVLRDQGFTKFGRVAVCGVRQPLWYKGRMEHPDKEAQKRMENDDLI